MNLWIETTRDTLAAAIAEVDCLMLNDAELRMLTEEPNLARAARAAMEMGPEIVVAKRGEYGAALFTADGFFAIPGYLLEDVRDPTGAGDSFAEGSSATSTPRTWSAPRPRRCGARWPTAPCSRPSTSRTSGPSASPG